MLCKHKLKHIAHILKSHNVLRLKSLRQDTKVVIPILSGIYICSSYLSSNCKTKTRIYDANILNIDKYYANILNINKYYANIKH